MTILVTGGAGYIGSHAVKLLLKQGYRVIVLDNLSRGHLGAIQVLQNFGELVFYQGDLRDPAVVARVFTEQKIAGVLHFAALCLVNESVEQPGLYFENNVGGSLNLFEAMRTHHVRNIIFSSTCAVYGETEYLPVDEQHPTRPANPYGESKLLTERMLYWYGQIYNFNYLIFRYFNVCGADSEGMIGDAKTPSQLLMQNAVRGAMGIEPFFYTCAEVDTPDGTPIRDYIDVEDLVAAHVIGLKYLAEQTACRVLNLGNGRGWSVKEIVAAVENHFGVSLNKQSGTVRKGEYARIYADPTLAQTVLGWSPHKDLLASITSLERWYREHPQGY